MKKLVVLIGLVACVFAIAHAQTKNKTAQYCCVKPDVEHSAMAMFTHSEAFKEAHPSPKPYEHKQANGNMITFATPDGKQAKAYYVKGSNPKPTKVLFIFHEWWGLNDHIKREADAWAAELPDFDVYALDLYDGKVATNPDDAAKYMTANEQARSEAIIKGLLKKVGNKAQIATLGWCFGGTWSFNASIVAGSQAKACVMYYGFPEKDVNRMRLLQPEVLYIHATNDAFIPVASVNKLEADLQSVGKKITVLSYDAVHAFANPSNPGFKAEYAAQAKERSINFIKTLIK